MNAGKSFKGGKNQRYGNSASANAARGQFKAGTGKTNKKKKIKYGSEPGNNKVWIAALAGASAGVIAGLLMAPESGRDTVDSLKTSALRLGDQIDEAFRKVMNRMEEKGFTRIGDSLQIQGKWDQIKGRIKATYGDLTDEDLAYIEGHEDRFLGNLEAKLGKTKRELVRWINSLA